MTRHNTVCKNGHPRTSENTYSVPKHGHIQCKTCRTANQRRRNKKLRRLGELEERNRRLQLHINRLETALRRAAPWILKEIQNALP